MPSPSGGEGLNYLPSLEGRLRRLVRTQATRRGEEGMKGRVIHVALLMTVLVIEFFFNLITEKGSRIPGLEGSSFLQGNMNLPQICSRNILRISFYDCPALFLA